MSCEIGCAVAVGFAVPFGSGLVGNAVRAGVESGWPASLERIVVDEQAGTCTARKRKQQRSACDVQRAVPQLSFRPARASR